MLGTWCSECGHEERVGGHDCTPVINAFHKAIRHELMLGRYELFRKWFTLGWEANADTLVEPTEFLDMTAAVAHLEILEGRVSHPSPEYPLLVRARERVIETSRAWLKSAANPKPAPARKPVPEEEQLKYLCMHCALAFKYVPENNCPSCGAVIDLEAGMAKPDEPDLGDNITHAVSIPLEGDLPTPCPACGFFKHFGRKPDEELGEHYIHTCDRSTL